MRISSENIAKIKEIFSKHFTNGKILLFGSRTDDKKKGGDIDLLILSDEKLKFNQISNFRFDLQKQIGDRKIDILNYQFNEKSIFLENIIEKAIEI